MVAGVILAFAFSWQMALLLLGLLPLIGFGTYIRSSVFDDKDKEDTKLLEEAGKVRDPLVPGGHPDGCEINFDGCVLAYYLFLVSQPAEFL